MSTHPSQLSHPIGRHAIVCGGSMAGLLTGGLLARHFERVTLVERDRIEQGAQHRKGVPQAHHLHGLLTRGMNILCDLYPGFREELKAAGARFLDMSAEHAWHMAGLWRPRLSCGVQFHAQSRPLLEWTVRKRLMALPNVRVLDGREVTGFQMGPDNARVTGVRLRAPGGGQEETLEGELVVDCTGRGSRTVQWLEALGYPRVEETRIHVDLGYASRICRPPPGFAPGWRLMSIFPTTPRERRFGAIEQIEGDRWLVLLGGWHGEHPPTDDAGYLEFARSLCQPHLHQCIQNAEPLGPINVYRFPHNQRRHFERMPRFPEGLVVVGDAACSFNPLYGQGITTSALQVEALGECLRQGLEGLARRYHRRAGKALEVPWLLATSGDLRFPEAREQRPLGLDLLNWYSERFQRLAGHDEAALRTFVRVLHMLESPAAMFAPRFVLKVLTARPDTAALSRVPECPTSSSGSLAA